MRGKISINTHSFAMTVFNHESFPDLVGPFQGVDIRSLKIFREFLEKIGPPVLMTE